MICKGHDRIFCTSFDVHNIFLSSSSHFQENMRIGIQPSLGAWCNSLVKPSGSRLLTFGEGLDGCISFLTVDGSIWIFQFLVIQCREVTHFQEWTHFFQLLNLVSQSLSQCPCRILYIFVLSVVTSFSFVILLDLFPVCFSECCQRFVNFISLFKEPALCCLKFCIVFLFFISFNSALILILYFWSQSLPEGMPID